MDKIEGVVDSIIYKDEATSYKIARINTGKDTIVCKGEFPNICDVGHSVVCEGELVKDLKYGPQLKATQINIVTPRTTQSIIKYLSAGRIKGIGPATAKSIVDKFGKDTLEVMENRPGLLTNIRGINHQKIVEISKSIVQIRAMERSITYLLDKGIGPKTADKIYEVYKDNTIEIVSSNPYRLIEDINGIGFGTADNIAREIGIVHDSSLRIRAGLVHVLRQSTDKDGNTYLPYDMTIESTLQLMSLQDASKINDIVQELVLDYKIKVLEINDTKVVMNVLCYQAEKHIATKLLELYTSASISNYSYNDEIAEFERVHNIQLHAAQVNAIKQSVNSGVCIITGGPGTGKTTIIKNILDIFAKHRLRIIMLAPTGRAAKRILETTGYEASTIHRALMKDGQMRTEPLACDVVIVDEMSMVDIFLFRNLLKAVANGTKLILVGDKDQLPSVGAGNVLRDLLQARVLPVAELSFIYRQGDNSLIAKNAHSINNGVMPQLDSKMSDFFFVDIGNDHTQDIKSIVVDLVVNRLPKFAEVQSTRIQVLSAIKNGNAGVIALNKQLQASINPPSVDKHQIELEYTTLREGDKVMNVVNNYQLKWKKRDNSETGEGVFNGDMGQILSILDNGEVVVLFDDDRVVSYNREILMQLMLAYAITIHKSQGSEFDVVVMPVVQGPSMMMTRNLLYTAITRGKKLVVLVGTRYAVEKMVVNNYVAMRYSALWYFLSKISQQQLLDDTVQLQD
ncbi:MAG: ATP-dependent RecD-like DNA helicase [Clostridiales bacterium]|jgi:exodeoxyribonuclease V alpha subunit|nr:ATP-dependent RecD-like DNA helicase [Clostridiales bacterium]